MTEQFWLVWCPGGPNGGQPTVRHRSRDDARREAERLARLNSGQQFYVLLAVEMCERNDVIWQALDEMPF